MFTELMKQGAQSNLKKSVHWLCDAIHNYNRGNDYLLATKPTPGEHPTLTHLCQGLLDSVQNAADQVADVVNGILSLGLSLEGLTPSPVVELVKSACILAITAEEKTIWGSVPELNRLVKEYTVFTNELNEYKTK